MRVAIGTVAIILLVTAGLLWPRMANEREARTFLADYNGALSQAVNSLDADKLDGFVGEGEKVRVGTYIQHLWGDDIDLRTQFISVEVLEVESSDPTMTVLARERWRDSEWVRSTGAVRKPAADSVHTLRYTLLRDGSGRLKVHRSEIVEGEGTTPP